MDVDISSYRVDAPSPHYCPDRVPYRTVPYRTVLYRTVPQLRTYRPYCATLRGICCCNTFPAQANKDRAEFANHPPVYHLAVQTVPPRPSCATIHAAAACLPHATCVRGVRRARAGRRGGTQVRTPRRRPAQPETAIPTGTAHGGIKTPASSWRAALPNPAARWLREQHPEERERSLASSIALSLSQPCGRNRGPMLLEAEVWQRSCWQVHTWQQCCRCATFPRPSARASRGERRQRPQRGSRSPSRCVDGDLPDCTQPTLPSTPTPTRSARDLIAIQCADVARRLPRSRLRCDGSLSTSPDSQAEAKLSA
eukprot:259809-Chlamydomonas_euryale.AAC.2